MSDREKIGEKRLRELEARADELDTYVTYKWIEGDELRSLIAGYRGYLNGIANIEYAQASGMVFCRMDILRDTLEAFQEDPKP